MPKRNLILFDDGSWNGLLPLTALRPVGELRVGLLTAAERWTKLLTGQVSYVTQDYLAEAYPLSLGRDNYFVNAACLPDARLVRRILALDPGEAITQEEELVAARLDDEAVERIRHDDGFDVIAGAEYEGTLRWLRRPFDLFRENARQIREDVALVCSARHSAKLPASNVVLGDGLVFLEAGVTCEAATLNTTGGPIYLGAGATIAEGSMLRGPLAVCSGATVKLGAKLVGGTTVGPQCKVSGEINNVVFQGQSSKAHEGYLGNAVIGRWCNIGAGTNASNLKNNYSTTRLYNYASGELESTGLRFCGLVMGDHVKCGIGTTFNTATVVGTGANVFGAGFPDTFIPDFSWGGPVQGWSTHRLDKMIGTAAIVLPRRGVQLSSTDREVLTRVFEATAGVRTWDAATR